MLSAPDSGFFFDDPDYPKWRSNLGWVVAAMNSSAGLNQRCVEAQRAAGKDPMECRYPEMAVRHTATPTFVMNSKFDPALLGISEGNPHGASKINAVGQKLSDLVNASALVSGVNAAFLTVRPPTDPADLTHRPSWPRTLLIVDPGCAQSCYQHCGQWAQGQTPEPGSAAPADANVTIDGFTGPQALNQWWGEVTSGRKPTRRLWSQEATYPCKTCCAGGQS